MAQQQKTDKQKNSGSSSSTYTWISIVSILLSLGIYLYLANQHYSLKLGLHTGPSICNISHVFNCDTVNSSKYSVLFGLPMAIWGFFTQLGLLTLFTIKQTRLIDDDSNSLGRYFSILSLFTASVSIVMGAISSLYIGSFCLFCMGLYVLSFTNLFAAIKKSPLNFSLLGSDLAKLLSPFRWVAIAMIAVIVGGAWIGDKIWLNSYDIKDFDIRVKENYQSWQSAPQKTFTSNNGLTLKDPTAQYKMTIVEFADFACPHCRSAYPGLDAFASSRPDVQLVFKYFPLDGNCNDGVERKGDGTRCTMSAIVQCAQTLKQSGWEAHHWIYDNQEDFSAASKEYLIEQATSTLSISKADLEKCINDESTLLAIKSAAAEGKGIGGTPSVFVNGKQIEGSLMVPTLEAIYKADK